MSIRKVNRNQQQHSTSKHSLGKTKVVSDDLVNEIKRLLKENTTIKQENMKLKQQIMISKIQIQNLKLKVLSLQDSQIPKPIKEVVKTNFVRNHLPTRSQLYQPIQIENHFEFREMNYGPCFQKEFAKSVQMKSQKVVIKDDLLDSKEWFKNKQNLSRNVSRQKGMSRKQFIMSKYKPFLQNDGLDISINDLK